MTLEVNQMKIRSLLLGTVAAAGLATGAQAADLGVLTSLDVCDSLGLSGLTISSDTNCLQITGSVSYRFQWGDWRTTDFLTNDAGFGQPWATEGGAPVTNIGAANGTLDWSSRVRATLGLTATADSEFGPAVAKITFYESSDLRSNATGAAASPGPGFPFWDTSHTNGVVIDEAYVSIGDTTVLSAGRKGSIANFGTDTPYNFGGLFLSNGNFFTADYNTAVANSIGGGVNFNDNFTGTNLRFGGDVIQIETDLGNGFYAKGGLENINGATFAGAGTLVGVVGYNGDSVTAHITGAAGGILDGVVEWFGVHAGAEVRFDNFKLLGAFAANNSGFINGLVSGQATFDMFTIAASAEMTTGGGQTQFGAGASISAKVTDGVTLNLGGKFFDPDLSVGGDSFSQAEIQVVASVTETITLTGGVGVQQQANPGALSPYATGIVAWNPGGGFTTSLRGDVQTGLNVGNGFGFRTEFNAAKTFN
jgi:hypothetical protein